MGKPLGAEMTKCGNHQALKAPDVESAKFGDHTIHAQARERITGICKVTTKGQLRHGYECW